jgi:hypothetical protein
MTKKLQPFNPYGDILLYQTEDGLQRIEVRLENETVWLSQRLMAELFQTTAANINIHLKNIFEEGELSPDSVIKDSLITAPDGKRYQTKLYRIVTAYLEFAEVQALNRIAMTMKDWIVKLDDFLKLSGRNILTHAGNISHEQALDRARAEYDKYRALHLNDEWPVEKHFLEATKKLAKPKSAKKKV